MGNIDRRRVERHRDEGVYVSKKFKKEKRKKKNLANSRPKKGNKFYLQLFFVI